MVSDRVFQERIADFEVIEKYQPSLTDQVSVGGKPGELPRKHSDASDLHLNSGGDVNGYRRRKIILKAIMDVPTCTISCPPGKIVKFSCECKKILTNPTKPPGSVYRPCIAQVEGKCKCPHGLKPIGQSLCY